MDVLFDEVAQRELLLDVLDFVDLAYLEMGEVRHNAQSAEPIPKGLWTLALVFFRVE